MSSTVSQRPELLVITGMSGAGKTRAASALEDLNWYVVDNLPPRLLVTFASMMRSGNASPRMAVVVDVRSGEYFREIEEVLAHIHGLGIDSRVMFLDASDAVLVRRYEQVRRPHPLQGGERLLDGIERERALLTPLKERADIVIDTSETSVHELARQVRAFAQDDADQRVNLTVMSFGFKHGIPLDADNVIDVRFLANPYWVPELRDLTGQDAPVRDYVLGLPGTREFIDGYVSTFAPVIERYAQELKPYVTLAVGCTGGRHRSVAIAEDIASKLRALGHRVRISHRDIGRD